MSLTCVIIDDEPVAIDVIARYVEKTPWLELAGQFTHPVKAMEYLNNNAVDILFVDIQMPDITGIELVKTLKNPPVIVFTTAYDDYALEGFRVDAVDYLLKPIDYPNFLKAAEKARELVMARKSPPQEVKTNNEFLFFKSEYKLVRLELAALEYIEGMSEYVKVHRESGKPIMSLLSLKALEQQLPTSKFMRIHKSYIVNLEKITEVESGFITLACGKTLPVSKMYKEAFQQYIDRNFMV